MSNDKIYIGARVPIKIKEALRKTVLSRGEDEADFIRRSVYCELARLDVLSHEEKKVLGVK